MACLTLNCTARIVSRDLVVRDVGVEQSEVSSCLSQDQIKAVGLVIPVVLYVSKHPAWESPQDVGLWLR